MQPKQKYYYECLVFIFVELLRKVPPTWRRRKKTEKKNSLVGGTKDFLLENCEIDQTTVQNPSSSTTKEKNRRFLKREKFMQTKKRIGISSKPKMIRWKLMDKLCNKQFQTNSKEKKKKKTSCLHFWVFVMFRHHTSVGLNYILYSTLPTAHLFCLLFIFLVWKFYFVLYTLTSHEKWFVFLSFSPTNPLLYTLSLSLVCIYGNVQFA